MIGGTRIDYWRLPLQKKSFIGSGQSGPIAGQYSHIQLWNPDQSGVIIILTNLETFVDSTAKQYFHVRTHNVSFAGEGPAGKSKYLGEAGPSGLIRTINNAALQGTTWYYKMRTLEVGNYKNQFILTEPLIIGPNMGLVVASGTVNTEVNAVFEWMEAG